MSKCLFVVLLVFSSSSFAGTTFKVLTFNLWTVELPEHKKVADYAEWKGGKTAEKLAFYETSQLIDERLKMLPTKVSETGADIVVFQEIWRYPRKLALIESFKAVGYPYAVFKYPPRDFSLGTIEPFRGEIGNGLLILSKFPLDTNVKVMKFSKFTRPDEYFTYKGAIKTRVNIPGVGWADLFDSHLGAYSTEPKSKTDPTPDHYNAEHLAKKFSQARELFNFIVANLTSEVIITAMDMNTHYNTYLDGKFQDAFAPEYALLTCNGRIGNNLCLGMVDSYRAIHGFTNPPAWTYDTQLNDYAKGGLFASEPQEVIDYIFMNQNSKIKPVDSQVVFDKRSTDDDKKEFGLEKLPPFLSDHYGVLTTFEVR